MRSAVARLLRRTPAERRLLAHAVVLHTAVALACHVLSFPRILGVLTRLYPVGSAGRDADARVLWAAGVAARWWPRRGTCLSHALTAQCLLRRNGCDASLRLGVRPRTCGRVDAHAWLERRGVVIVGGDVEPYVPVWGSLTRA